MKLYEIYSLKEDEATYSRIFQTYEAASAALLKLNYYNYRMQIIETED